MGNNDPQKYSEFDGVRFVNVLLLVIFIALLFFGSSNIPNIPSETPIEI